MIPTDHFDLTIFSFIFGVIGFFALTKKIKLPASVQYTKVYLILIILFSFSIFLNPAQSLDRLPGSEESIDLNVQHQMVQERSESEPGVRDTGSPHNQERFWTLQLGSYKRIESAKEILERQSFKDARIEKNGDWYTVRLGHFETENEARTLQEQLPQEMHQGIIIRTGFYRPEQVTIEPSQQLAASSMEQAHPEIVSDEPADVPEENVQQVVPFQVEMEEATAEPESSDSMAEETGEPDQIFPLLQTDLADHENSEGLAAQLPETPEQSAAAYPEQKPDLQRHSILNPTDTFAQSILSLLLVLLGLLLWTVNARYAMILLCAFLQVRYLLWRGVYTLDTITLVGLTVTVILFVAELYGLIQNLLFYYQIKKPIHRVPGEPTVYPTVDIFVTIVNEPIEILKRTLVGCLAQDYPEEQFTVHVLDDGGREEVRGLAQDLGCQYHRREEKAHAKAGNINHALKHTRGELVALFDVDHVPVRDFLKHTVSFFEDEKVAIVQTPQHFYNPDVFQKNLRLEKEIRNEQGLFFRVIQAGRDAHNSAFFAGSSGLFRRKALEEIGGFRTDTLTEDLHTSLVLHSRGWKSCYLNEVLSAGLSPESLNSYQKQRDRWAVGAVQTLLKDNPLFTKGLKYPQRLNYFASIYYFLHGLPRIVFLAAPLSFLLFGVTPIVAKPMDLVHYFFSYYIASVFMINLIGQGYRKTFWSDVYETVVCFRLSKTVIKTFFTPKRTTFHVTPKGEVGERRLEWKQALPHTVLLAAILIGIVRGLMMPLEENSALWISLFWAFFNIFILILAIFTFLERTQRRGLIRLRRSVPCTIKSPWKKATGMTLDISEEGMSVCLEQEFYFLARDIEVELMSSYGEVTRLKGDILRQEKTTRGTEIGIRFREMDEKSYQSLVRQMYSPLESWKRKKAEKGLLRDLVLPVLGLIGPWKKDKNLTRLHPRLPVHRDCTFISDQERFNGTTVDLSYSGLSIQIEPVEDKDLVRENVLVEMNGILLKVFVVAVENERYQYTLHLKVQTIEKGERSWENMALPS
jgi:cellulose synthase (UDP-forming)